MHKLFYFFLLFSLSLNAQVFDSEWIGNKPIGNNLNDITKLPTGEVFAFGDFGIILKTSDDGLSWQYEKIDTANDNRSIYEGMFVNATVGYACGVDGLLKKTVDGGNTWTDLPNSLTTQDLWYIDMISADTGYTVGSSSTLLKTTDAGATWNTIPLSGTAIIYKVHFVTPQTGFLGTSSATPGRLLKTTDYGATWNPVASYTSTSSVRGIYFFDEDTGYVSNAGLEIWKTTDGGATFNMMADLGTGSLYEIKFTSWSTGFATGPSGDVFVTTDYGVSWNPINIGNVSNLYGLTIQGNLGDGDPDIYVSGEGGAIAKSTNNGTTWQQFSRIVSLEDLREIKFLENPVQNGVSATGFVVGGSTTAGELFKTTDEGLTWLDLSANVGADYRLYSQFWVNDQIGFVGKRGPDGLYKTTNGGSSFTQLNTAVGTSTNIWYTIKFADANIGYAGGSNGNFVKTTDGGSSWTDLPDGFGTSIIYDAHLFDASTLVLVGASSKIYKTTDGGASFFQLGTPSPLSAIYSVNFVNTDTGYICGGSGRAYKTTDGGLNWLLMSTPGTNTLYKILFVNSDLGWISGSGGTMWYTLDGGTTWNVADKFPASATIYSMSIADGRLYVAGGSGSILAGYADPSVPVELTSFSASVSGNKVVLNWQTATETNNSGFEIERRSASTGWTKIGFVPGFGTTAELKNYSFRDENLSPGVFTYRLKQIDFNGTYIYSSEAEVEITSPVSFGLDQNYPNPFNPATQITYSIAKASHVSLKIFNAIGEEVAVLVNSLQQSGKYTFNFNASNLGSGIYFYRLEAGEYTNTKKMILIK